MTRILLVIAVLFTTVFCSYAQTPAAIDVQHYRFELSLSDQTDTIRGTATISIKFLKNTSSFRLHLGNIIDSSGKGMKVMSVTESGREITYLHSRNTLLIQFPAVVKTGEIKTVLIRYEGIPSDGLIIAKSIYKKRTFFGDNWPNRAQCWLPCNDTPSDKAGLEFIITAPHHYRIISNGIQTEELSLTDSTKRTHWKEEVPLPTKVMVFGAADFTVSDAVYAGTIPVTSWIYEDEKEKGFYDYALAPAILQYFTDYIGPYGYKKLANVQSKTKFGGMENAGAIFYFENSITGKGGLESLLAHEIAHQWFGNMVTETDFKHIWLSEGFATYMTDVYMEARYGIDTLNSRLKRERDAVIAYASESVAPVIDTTADYKKLLNPNSYEKGAWILHMLRNTVGDAAFKTIIREQYKKFAGKNASSADFIATAERVSNKKLRPFFNQWLYKTGFPVLAITWKNKVTNKKVIITIEQKQAGLFSFPISLKLITQHGEITKTVSVQKRKVSIIIPVQGEVTGIIPDPDCKLLWQEDTVQKK